MCEKNLQPECAQKSSTIKENCKRAKDVNKCFSKVGEQTNTQEAHGRGRRDVQDHRLSGQRRSMRCTPSRAAGLKQANNNKCCFWMWKNRNACVLLVGIQNGADTPGSSLAVPREAIHGYPVTQQLHAWIHTQGNLKHVHTKP